ncbi:MAG: DNA-binding response regulator, partial [Pseudomonadales bacterium]|nr:DNA-binding response regulator [Pseudomonadales bacterium]
MADANILIVDDEEAIREMISVSLELAGFQWMEAENGQLAHSMIVDERPDLILL